MSLRREEEESQEPITREVTFVEETGGISAVIPGEQRFVDKWCEQPAGIRTTNLKVGKEFHIKCHYISINVGALTWGSLVTVRGVGADSVIANYEDTSIIGPKIDKTVTLGNRGNNYVPSGTGTMQLRFKIWMNDSHFWPEVPPISEW